MSSMPVPTPEPLVDVTRAQELIGAAGLDAIAVHSLQNLYYLSGYFFTDFLVEPEASAFTVLPASNDAAAQVTISAWARYTLEEYPVWPPAKIFVGSFYVKNGPPVEGDVASDSVEGLIRALRATGAETGRVGFELSQLPIGLHRRIVDALPQLEAIEVGPLLRELRKHKTPVEIERIRTATDAIDASIRDALEHVRVGVTEQQIDRWIREGLIARGVSPASVFVGAQRRGAYVISHATEHTVAVGDVVRLDVTASYGLYHSDLARACVVGESTAEQEGYYRAVRDALDVGIEAVQPRGAAADVFDATVEAVRGAGFADFQRTNVGHGVGLHVHEQPILSPAGGEIPDSAVLAVEVPYYVYDVGAFQTEDVVVVSQDGVERLTQAPVELRVVG
jgi:Xaa-Pro dipeptidase